MKRILFSIPLLLLPLLGVSQCKNFVKKECLPMLETFTHNGQLNSATLVQGETAELAMTFYSGQNYRLVIKGQEHLGVVTFRILDSQKNEVYSNTKDNNATKWDFNVESTQIFYIEVSVPKSEATHKMVQSGCVAILLGFKKG